MGDAVIYERYDGGYISKGQVIIFDYNGIQTIHRITEIKNGSMGDVVLTAQWTVIQYNINYLYDNVIGDY